jgi:hypothetical protein
MNTPGSPARSIRAGLILLLTLGAAASAAVVQEDFSTDPAAHGWIRFGDQTLFRWNSSEQWVDVTWDSSRSNSFIARPLGTILSMADDFSFSFDLRLRDIQVGTTPGKSNEFEIAVGLIQLASATNSNAYRGAGQNATYGVHNLVEFDYFPDAGFGDTFATTVVSTNNRIFPAHTFPLALTAGDLFRMTLSYTAADQTLRTRATRNGLPYGLAPDNALADLVLSGKPDFRVDAFAVTSYSDAIQAGPLSVQGSVLAHGALDNVRIELPAPPVDQLSVHKLSGQWVTEFRARTNWVYTLERSTGWPTWSAASAPTPGREAALVLADTNPPATAAWYRIRAERP